MIIVFSIVEFPIPHCIPLSCVQMPLSPIKPSHQTSGPRCLRALQLVNLSPSLKVPKSASQVQTQAVIGVSIQPSLDQTNPWSSNVSTWEMLGGLDVVFWSHNHEILDGIPTINIRWKQKMFRIHA